MPSKSSTISELLRQNTEPGEEASVWDTTSPHTSRDHPELHTDATLYVNDGNGTIREVEHTQINESENK